MTIKKQRNALTWQLTNRITKKAGALFRKEMARRFFVYFQYK